jgi:hypothetical protein
MPQLIKPSTKIKVIPRDGELEITLNINITVDGQVFASSDKAEVKTFKENEEEEKSPHIIPDFFSGTKLNFGKKDI